MYVAWIYIDLAKRILFVHLKKPLSIQPMNLFLNMWESVNLTFLPK